MLEDRQVGGFQAQVLVGLIACGDLRCDERAQHVLWWPALRSGGLEYFGRLGTDGRQLSRRRPAMQLWCEWWSVRTHRSAATA